MLRELWCAGFAGGGDSAGERVCSQGVCLVAIVWLRGGRGGEDCEVLVGRKKMEEVERSEAGTYTWAGWGELRGSRTVVTTIVA